MSQHDHTTPIETLLGESDDAQRRDAASTGVTDRTDRTDNAHRTHSSDSSVAAGRYDTSGPHASSQGSTAVPEFRSGPAPTTTIVGLLGLLTTIALLVTQSTDLDIPWGVVGPVAVVGAGVLLVVLGLAGLRGQRFRG